MEAQQYSYSTSNMMMRGKYLKHDFYHMWLSATLHQELQVPEFEELRGNTLLIQTLIKGVQISKPNCFPSNAHQATMNTII